MNFAFARNTVEVSAEVAPSTKFAVGQTVEIDGKKFTFLGIAPNGNLLLNPIKD